MRRFLSALSWLMLGVSVALALLEATLRLLPVPIGLYRTHRYEQWPLQAYEPSRPYTYSRTWALRNVHRGMTNNYGHLAPFDFRPGSMPVVVLGDSFIEAQMNAYDETLQGRLGALLDDPRRVYGLGVSGLSLSDYLALSRLARDEFSPSAAVIVISDGDISESISGEIGHYSFALKDGAAELTYRPLYGESVLKKIRTGVGEISLYRYLQNLGFSPAKIVNRVHGAPPAAASREDPRPDRLFVVVDTFLRDLSPALGVSPGCIAFLLDSDRYAIYKPELATKRKDGPELRGYFLQQATALGYRAADLDPVFRRAYASDKVKFDYWPMDRHWNAVGHDIAAHKAYELLFEPGSGDCRPGQKRVSP
jgi:hypothetical protein